MTWAKSFSCPELGSHKSQHSVCIPFHTQLSSQTGASWLEISLSVKEVPKTTFLYHYTFCFYFQNALLLMFYVHGRTAAASPGASLAAHPHAPGCMKLCQVVLSLLYTPSKLLQREKGALQNALEALSGCCNMLGWWWEAGMLPPFTKQPDSSPYTHLSSGKAYLGGRRYGILIPHPPMERALANHNAPCNPTNNRGFGRSPDCILHTSSPFHRLLWKLSKCYCLSWCKRAPRNLMLEVSFK